MTAAEDQRIARTAALLRPWHRRWVRRQADGDDQPVESVHPFDTREEVEGR